MSLPSSASHVEKRRFPRSRADHSIAIQLQNRRLVGVCVNYSESGFGAIIEGELPIGEIVSVEFPVARRELTRLQVRTVGRQDSMYGFEFVAPEGDQRRTLAEFFKESVGE